MLVVSEFCGCLGLDGLLQPPMIGWSRIDDATGIRAHFAIGIFVLEDPLHFIEEAELPVILQNCDGRRLRSQDGGSCLECRANTLSSGHLVCKRKARSQNGSVTPLFFRCQI
jgi:hypothetical protein